MVDSRAILLKVDRELQINYFSRGKNSNLVLVDLDLTMPSTHKGLRRVPRKRDSRSTLWTISVGAAGHERLR